MEYQSDVLPTEMNTATLSWVTPNGDHVIAHRARMSAQVNQAKSAELLRVSKDLSVNDIERQLALKQFNEMTSDLITRCVRDGHFSVLEQASMAVFIKTSRAIAPQLLRHDAQFQEFSQRYSTVKEPIECPEMRVSSGRYRDRSALGVGGDHEVQALAAIRYAEVTYQDLLDKGVHPESARMVLPMCVPTYIHMATNMRNWFFYLKNRMSHHAQAEHNQIARCVYQIMAEHYPLLTRSFNQSLDKDN